MCALDEYLDSDLRIPFDYACGCALKTVNHKWFPQDCPELTYGYEVEPCQPVRDKAEALIDSWRVREQSDALVSPFEQFEEWATPPPSLLQQLSLPV